MFFVCFIFFFYCCLCEIQFTV